MAAEKKYPTPLEQVAVIFRAAKLGGQPDFGEVWDRLWAPEHLLVLVTDVPPMNGNLVAWLTHDPAGAIRWPTDRASRRTWQTAIRASEGGWRRAYEDRPATPAQVALMQLAPGILSIENLLAAREAERAEIVEVMQAA